MMFLFQLVPSEKNATSVVLDALRALCLWVCRFVYKLIAFFYELFMNMTQIEILQQPEIEKLYKRVTILLGLIMLFVSIFFLLKMLLNPDKINDKEQGMGSLVKRIISVILMLGFVPSIFTMANELQKKVITSDIIPKILLGKTFAAGGDSSNTSTFAQNYGRRLSANLFTTFYYKNEDIISEDDECTAYDFIEQEMATYGTIETAVSCVNNKGTAKGEMGGANTKAYVIEYDSLGSVFVGIAVLWMIIVYTINVGVRIIQFTFLQVIAPIPIISYVYPQKDGMFQKWVRQSITTYLDLFIRLGVIYFVFYLTDLIFNHSLLDNLSETNTRWIQIILILALLVFAKRLPKLLQEMAGKPNAASLGFGVSGSNGAAGVLMGAASVGAMGFLGSTGAARFTGLAKGLVTGGLAGASGGNYNQNMRPVKDKMRRSNETDEWLKMQGYRGLNRYYQRAVMASGGIPKGRRLEQQALLDKEFKAQLQDDDRVKPFTTAKTQFFTYSGRYEQFMSDLGGGLYGIMGADGQVKLTYDSQSGISYDEDGNVINKNDLYTALDKMEKRKMEVVANDKNERGVQAARRAMTRAQRYTPGRKRAYIQDLADKITRKDFKYGRFNTNRKNTLGSKSINPGPFGSGRGPGI